MNMIVIFDLIIADIVDVVTSNTDFVVVIIIISVIVVSVSMLSFI